MIEDKTPDTGGQPTYEQNIQVPQEATSASIEQRIQDKTVKGYDAYGINRPQREVIYAKIVKQEQPKKPCIKSEETKTTE